MTMEIVEIETKRNIFSMVLIKEVKEVEEVKKEDIES